MGKTRDPLLVALSLAVEGLVEVERESLVEILGAVQGLARAHGVYSAEDVYKAAPGRDVDAAPEIESSVDLMPSISASCELC